MSCARIPYIWVLFLFFSQHQVVPLLLLSAFFVLLLVDTALLLSRTSKRRFHRLLVPQLGTTAGRRASLALATGETPSYQEPPC
jgi:hypothetical protein